MVADAVTREGEAVQDMKKDILAAVTAVETETVTLGTLCLVITL